MSKKSYKRNQNRLYREIKRRMILENALKMPVPIRTEVHKIETVKVRHLVDKEGIPQNSAAYAEYIKHDMAQQIADTLMKEGYISYYTRERPDEFIYKSVEIEARIKVVR